MLKTSSHMCSCVIAKPIMHGFKTACLANMCRSGRRAQPREGGQEIGFHRSLTHVLKVTPAKNVPGVEDEGQKMLLLKQLADLEELLRLQSELAELERQKACVLRDLIM